MDSVEIQPKPPFMELQSKPGRKRGRPKRKSFMPKHFYKKKMANLSLKEPTMKTQITPHRYSWTLMSSSGSSPLKQELRVNLKRFPELDKLMLAFVRRKKAGNDSMNIFEMFSVPDIREPTAGEMNSVSSTKQQVPALVNKAYGPVKLSELKTALLVAACEKSNKTQSLVVETTLQQSNEKQNELQISNTDKNGEQVIMNGDLPVKNNTVKRSNCNVKTLVLETNKDNENDQNDDMENSCEDDSIPVVLSVTPPAGSITLDLRCQGDCAPILLEVSGNKERIEIDLNNIPERKDKRGEIMLSSISTRTGTSAELDLERVDTPPGRDSESVTLNSDVPLVTSSTHDEADRTELDLGWLDDSASNIVGSSNDIQNKQQTVINNEKSAESEELPSVSQNNTVADSTQQGVSSTSLHQKQKSLTPTKTAKRGRPRKPKTPQSLETLKRKAVSSSKSCVTSVATSVNRVAADTTNRTSPVSIIPATNINNNLPVITVPQAVSAGSFFLTSVAPHPIIISPTSIVQEHPSPPSTQSEQNKTDQHMNKSPSNWQNMAQFNLTSQSQPALPQNIAVFHLNSQQQQQQQNLHGVRTGEQFQLQSIRTSAISSPGLPTGAIAGSPSIINNAMTSSGAQSTITQSSAPLASPPALLISCQSFATSSNQSFTTSSNQSFTTSSNQSFTTSSNQSFTTSFNQSSYQPSSNTSSQPSHRLTESNQSTGGAVNQSVNSSAFPISSTISAGHIMTSSPKAITSALRTPNPPTQSLSVSCPSMTNQAPGGLDLSLPRATQLSPIPNRSIYEQFNLRPPPTCPLPDFEQLMSPTTSSVQKKSHSKSRQNRASSTSPAASNVPQSSSSIQAVSKSSHAASTVKQLLMSRKQQTGAHLSPQIVEEKAALNREVSALVQNIGLHSPTSRSDTAQIPVSIVPYHPAVSGSWPAPNTSLLPVVNNPSITMSNASPVVLPLQTTNTAMTMSCNGSTTSVTSSVSTVASVIEPSQSISMSVRPYSQSPDSCMPLKKRALLPAVTQAQGRVIGGVSVIYPMDTPQTADSNTSGQKKKRRSSKQGTDSDSNKKTKKTTGKTKSKPDTYGDRAVSSTTSWSNPHKEQYQTDVRHNQTHNTSDASVIMIKPIIDFQDSRNESDAVSVVSADTTSGASTLDTASIHDLYNELKRRGALSECICGIHFQTGDADRLPMYYLHRSCHNTDNPKQCGFCDFKATNWFTFFGHHFDHTK